MTFIKLLLLLISVINLQEIYGYGINPANKNGNIHGTSTVHKMVKRNGLWKLTQLRALMKNVYTGGREKGIQALIVNGEDAHQSEYSSERDQRRRFISGFRGSYGTVVVLPDAALLWTDGRYYQQALSEMDPSEAWTLMREGLLDTPTIAVWLASNLPPKSVVGADANLISYTEWARLHTTLTAAGHSLISLSENLVDKVWGDEQPARTANKVVPQPLQYSGQSTGDKVKLCRKAMQENDATVLVVTALDEIAYLLNWRGSDIPFNPVFFAYVILTTKDLHVFIDKSRVSQEALEQLKNEGVPPIIHEYEDIHAYMKEFVSSLSDQDKIWISNKSSYALHANCGDIKKHTDITPISIMKSIKNAVEVEGMKSSHARDSVALVKYFAWLEDKIKNTNERITEISGATRLEQFRQEQDHFVGLSFTTISSVGPHGAVIHYAPSPETDVPITDKELYLCDSGAQYKDGTTDVTRTFHFGEPTNFERECFTRVFKGQCRLSTTIFPFKTKGNYLDTLARESLWSIGLDYLHGTGHGVGAYLNVHEEPIGISWKPHPDDPGLQPGMFLSNEPGYYEDGKFGIRLENVELVVPAKTPHNFKNRGYLTFETMTLVPIQTSLLNISMLTDHEIEYLNNYHAKCLKVLKPFLQGPENAQALKWLEKQTLPISR
ncbi:xaa-Pro aminopeptidase ApepP isoform X1 [Pogonomyrmex barbatus]|uniref:Xaa-Pro aminopeptidase ApepP isoform X1 n=2 Tax=Pogonomyrmex barbatus TaxID=144034 RepID=A0A6I9XHI3_9HYME|nr:xaa-Pro aminopeptidase ApepP isoform X1 [Pogonomyrmex barbatus]